MTQINSVASEGNNNKPDDKKKKCFHSKPVWPQAHKLSHKAGSTSPRLKLDLIARRYL